MTVIERFSQHRWAPAWVRHQHLARYEWACQFARGARVLDAACGTGYGSRMLAAAGATHVQGLDIDADALAEAAAQPGTACLEFAMGDVTALPLEDAWADLFVCFETIEHVENDDAAVREAARVLRPSGRFLCSSPNRTVTNPGTAIHDPPFNRFHVREYTLAEFDALLRRHFAEVTWHGQTFLRWRWMRLLTFVARLHHRSAVRCHQARKLLGMPWERKSRHMPRAIAADVVPEFLIAECIR
jgi:ubiquinone/menaquinone biosynthesis C-methylase UbiE